MPTSTLFGTKNIGFFKIFGVSRAHGVGVTPPCDKCGVVFSYVYTNSTKLVGTSFILFTVQ